MLAGHIVLFSILGLVYVFGFIAVPAFFIGIAIYALEIFVALLQAYLFTFLSALFIGEMFHQIRRERSLAQALALSYFDVEPELEETYASAKDRLQLFWAKHDSALDVSKGTLPASEEWDSWWEGLGKLQDDEGLMERAAERRMAVRTEGAQLRGIMIWVMREWGALENK